MAAFKATIQEIDEKLLQCAICIDRLEEPKILPCGHHYCRSCLMEISRHSNNCPTCQRAYKLPSRGVDGLATDYYAKNLIKLVEAQESSTEVSCSDHPGRLAELGCKTCGLQPICAICTCTVHKGHNMEDIATLAENARKRMAGKLEELKRLKERIEQKQRERESARRKLDLEEIGWKDGLRGTLDRENVRIKEVILDEDQDLERQKEDLEERLRRRLVPHKQRLQKEMKRAQEKYDRARQKELRAVEDELGKLQRKNKVEKGKLGVELVKLNKKITIELEQLEEDTEASSRRFEELNDRYDCFMRKVGELTLMASDLTASDSHWKEVWKISGVCSCIDSFTKEVESEEASLWHEATFYQWQQDFV